jgi:hypothetical protein
MHTKEGEHNKTREANRNKRKKNDFHISDVSTFFQPSLAQSHLTCDSFVVEEIQTCMTQKMEQVTARQVFGSLLSTSASGQISPGVAL